MPEFFYFLAALALLCVFGFFADPVRIKREKIIGMKLGQKSVDWIRENYE